MQNLIRRPAAIAAVAMATTVVGLALVGAEVADDVAWHDLAVPAIAAGAMPLHLLLSLLMPRPGRRSSRRRARAARRRLALPPGHVRRHRARLSLVSRRPAAGAPA